MEIVNVVYGKIMRRISEKDALVVGRTGLNDNDGVFAVSFHKFGTGKKKQIFWTFYLGDDGSWKKLATFDSHWIVKIIQCLIIWIDLQEKLLEK